MIRLFVAPFMAVAVAAGMVATVDPAIAQPPGKGFEKGKGFDKGFFEKGKAAEKGGPGDAVRTLEAELAKLKSLEADLEQKLKQLKAPAPKSAPPGPGGFGPGGFGPGGFGPGGFGPGGFGPGGFGRSMHGGWGEHARGPEMPGGSSRGMPGAVQGVVRAASGLSAAQLKEVIAALQKLQSEKQRADAPAPRSPERPSYRPEGRPETRPSPKSEGRSGTATNEQILERLDRLARELDEIRRAVRK